VGYRHFDKADLEVSYPFGYGLSYTDFEFTRMNVTLENDTIDVAVVVQNIGEKAGKEVIQIYVAKPNTSIDRPVQELKAFAKTKNLKPGETENVVVHIPVHELSYWNEEASGWKIEKGTYKIRSGASSRDIRLFEEIEI